VLGSHLSIAGGLTNALHEARRLGMDCVQIFTKNQRQWAAPPLRDDAVDEWHATLHQLSFPPDHVVSHDSYLINLASPERSTRERSIKLMRDELERCERLAIPNLVAHPGAHLGLGVDTGVDRIARALDRVHKSPAGYRTRICLENTAGQGTTIGHELEHLRDIIDATREPDRLGVCIDTAHALAAGYDLTSAPGARDFIKHLDSTIGLTRVRCLHLNDSKVERGRRVDRHEHIGHGHVALDAFRVILNHPRLRPLPMILETPKLDAPDGRPWDTVNLETLHALLA